MTELHDSLRPDTTDMMAVHRVFRQALATAPALIGGAPRGDTARAGVVASYYDNVLRFLKVHHEAEDELVWPKLRQRCPADAVLVDRMVGHHEDVHGALDRAAALVPGWAVSADAAAAGELTAALAELGDRLIPHLDEEEERVVPLCAEHLTMEEWGQMPGHALAHYDGDKVWLILGLIRENMTQTQRDAMLEHMPPPPREMWLTMGNAAFDAFIAEVRGPLSA